MAAGPSPATFVACAPLAWRGSDRAGLARPAVPITWITSLNSLSVAAEAGAAGATIALELLPAWFCTKQSLRDAIAVARSAVPSLDTAVIEGAVPRHHDVLAAAGIRVVAVDVLAPVQRGSRRPAPQGWACRTVAWGLWEVLVGPDPRQPRGWLSWTGLGRRPRAGSLHVHRLACRAARADRWLAWATRLAARGGVAATLADLPELIEGRRGGPLAGSILKAA
jgi:hypothetical protein